MVHILGLKSVHPEIWAESVYETSENGQNSLEIYVEVEPSRILVDNIRCLEITNKRRILT